MVGSISRRSSHYLESQGVYEFPAEKGHIAEADEAVIFDFENSGGMVSQRPAIVHLCMTETGIETIIKLMMTSLWHIQKVVEAS